MPFLWIFVSFFFASQLYINWMGMHPFTMNIRYMLCSYIRYTQLPQTCVLMTILYCNTLNEKLFNQLIGIGQKLLWSSSFNYVHSSTNTLSSHMHGFSAIIIYISYNLCVLGVCVDDKLLLGFMRRILYIAGSS